MGADRTSPLLVPASPQTTTLYKLHLGEVVSTQPTIGANVEEVKFRNLTFECWDIGGQTSLRPTWAHYASHTSALILVVDSTDRARMPLAREELWRLLDGEELAGTALLVLANKQDLRDAMSVAELSEALGLSRITRNPWHVQAACAVSGAGLEEGLQWISQRLTSTSTAAPASPAQPGLAVPAAPGSPAAAGPGHGHAAAAAA